MQRSILVSNIGGDLTFKFHLSFYLLYFTTKNSKGLYFLVPTQQGTKTSHRAGTASTTKKAAKSRPLQLQLQPTTTTTTPTKWAQLATDKYGPNACTYASSTNVILQNH